MSDIPRTEAALKASRNQFDALQKLTSEAAKLERENAALRADKERMDWLSTESGSKWAHHESEQCNITRRAIDAARKAQP